MKRLAAAAAALVLTTTAVVAGSATSSSAVAPPRLQAYGIAGGGTLMLGFWTDTPDRNDWVKRITGLVGDRFVVDIDIRPQDGKLYALGDAGGVYAIPVPNTGSTKVGQLSVPLYGTKFDIDFNPAADRLRIISDNGQNLRFNLNDGKTTEDTTLTTPPMTGPAKQVTASAYTNNDLDTTTNTTLEDIDTKADQVVIQSPPNNGFLVATGSLGFDATLDAAFDVYSDLDNNGKTLNNLGFASLTPYSTGLQTFYTIDLLTGAAQIVDAFPLDVTGIAIAPDWSY